MFDVISRFFLGELGCRQNFSKGVTGQKSVRRYNSNDGLL